MMKSVINSSGIQKLLYKTADDKNYKKKKKSMDTSGDLFLKVSLMLYVMFFVTYLSKSKVSIQFKGCLFCNRL